MKFFKSLNFFKSRKQQYQQEADKRLWLMFDLMPYCVSFWTTDLQLIDCNLEAVKLFGLGDKSEFIEDFFKLSPEYQPCGRPSREKALEFMRKAFAQGSYRTEWLHQKPDGEPVPCEVTLVRIDYHDGQILTVYTRDLRQHQQMTKKLERQNNLLEMVNMTATALLTTGDDEEFEYSLLSSLELICHCMDVDRVQLWQNEMINGELYFALKYQQLSNTGRQKKTVPPGLKLPYSSRPGWEKNFLRGEHINSPVCNFSAENRDFFNFYDIKSIVLVPLFLQEQFWGFFSVDDCRLERVFPEEEIDIFRSASLMMVSAINRHTQTAKVRDADGLTQMLLDAMPLSCTLWDQNLNRLTCNQAFVKLHKLKGKQDYIDKFSDLSPKFQPDGRLSEGAAIEYIKKTMENGYNRFEWLHQTLDREPIPAEVTLVRLKRRGEYIIAAYIRDLREHKAMIAEMKKAEDDLRLARDAAESSSRAKSVFLANMSHEIRTPMNSIVGFSELALDGEPSPKTRDYLNKITENAGGLLQIINDILDISKVESGKMELEKIPFDIHDLFASCRTLILPKAFEKGIMLHFYAEPSLNKMPLGDPTRLRQVLINLLSNAVKFTNAGVIKVCAEITAKTDSSITIHFEVRDSGIGMTGEQLEKIFDPFTQAETGTTRQYGGTGLGLAITKNIVELMGGKLAVESAPGIGSKFSVDLTFETIDITDDNMFNKKMTFNELEKPTFEGEVLLCEDNTMNQQVICEHLARVGLATVVAENGSIGVEMVKKRMEKGEKQFDLIFMDMHMPVMDGLEASAKILALNVKIPIVAMTANIMSNDREIYQKSGLHDCVGKPFTSQELWRCLIKYFKPVKWQIADEKQRGGQADDILRQKLAATFLQENRQKYAEAAAALKAGDIKLAHRLAHTLKSNAAQLGKTALQEAAAEVENRLKDGAGAVTPAQMAALETELNAALAQLAHEVKGFANETPGEAGEPLDARAALELLAELEPLLEMGNAECQTYTARLRGIPGSEELIQHIENFDFKPALGILAGLRAGLA